MEIPLQLKTGDLQTFICALDNNQKSKIFLVPCRPVSSSHAKGKRVRAAIFGGFTLFKNIDKHLNYI